MFQVNFKLISRYNRWAIKCRLELIANGLCLDRYNNLIRIIQFIKIINDE